VRPFLEREDPNDEAAVQAVTSGSRPYLKMLTSSYFKNSMKNFYFEHVYDENSK
jgi:hypothetical protein